MGVPQATGLAAINPGYVPGPQYARPGLAGTSAGLKVAAAASAPPPATATKSSKKKKPKKKSLFSKVTSTAGKVGKGLAKKAIKVGTGVDVDDL